MQRLVTGIQVLRPNEMPGVGFVQGMGMLHTLDCLHDSEVEMPVGAFTENEDGSWRLTNPRRGWVEMTPVTIAAAYALTVRTIVFNQVPADKVLWCTRTSFNPDQGHNHQPATGYEPHASGAAVKVSYADGTVEWLDIRDFVGMTQEARAEFPSLTEVG